MAHKYFRRIDIQQVLSKRRPIVFFAVISLTLILVLAFGITTPTTSFAQSPTPTPAPNPGGAPPPPSVGADVPLTYFGPAPSQVQKELIGPHQLLKSGTVDLNASTITVPLYLGHTKDGKNVWYVLTDTNDKGNADALGLNFSAKLTYAAVGKGVRVATLEKDTSLTFDSGTVDFSPEREVVAGDGPNAFPPKTAKPGSIGDSDYTPLVRIQNAGNTIYNAPIVAHNVDANQISFCDGKPDHKLVHDEVVAICPEKQTVTLALRAGFSFARPVLYVSLDASVPDVAALEGVTYAPGLADITVGHDDSAFSAVERLFAMANGPLGKENPQRQGLSSAVLGEGRPLTVLSCTISARARADGGLGIWLRRIEVTVTTPNSLLSLFAQFDEGMTACAKNARFSQSSTFAPLSTYLTLNAPPQNPFHNRHLTT